MPTINEITLLEDKTKIADSVFMVADIDEFETKRGANAGKPYLRLKLTDESGAIKATLWSEFLERHRDALADLQVGSRVKVSGSKESYMDRPQITVRALEVVGFASAEERQESLPYTKRVIEDMQAELDSAIASIEHPGLKNLLGAIFSDDKVAEAYAYRPARNRDAAGPSPAAAVMHHAYMGGLIEHSLSVARLARSSFDIASVHYCEYLELDNLSRDLTVAGALLHDLGKVYEYKPNMGGYSELGKNIGHISLGFQMVTQFAERTGALRGPENKRILDRLGHVILSHHGKLEWGSPVEPKTLEAVIVHYCDDMDAKIKNSIDRLAKTAAGEAAKTAATAAPAAEPTAVAMTGLAAYPAAGDEPSGPADAGAPVADAAPTDPADGPEAYGPPAVPVSGSGLDNAPFEEAPVDSFMGREENGFSPLPEDDTPPDYRQEDAWQSESAAAESFIDPAENGGAASDDWVEAIDEPTSVEPEVDLPPGEGTDPVFVMPDAAEGPPIGLNITAEAEAGEAGPEDPFARSDALLVDTEPPVGPPEPAAESTLDLNLAEFVKSKKNAPPESQDSLF